MESTANETNSNNIKEEVPLDDTKKKLDDIIHGNQSPHEDGPSLQEMINKQSELKKIGNKHLGLPLGSSGDVRQRTQDSTHPSN